jgi:hypothetical protein
MQRLAEFGYQPVLLGDPVPETDQPLLLVVPVGAEAPRTVPRAFVGMACLYPYPYELPETTGYGPRERLLDPVDWEGTRVDVLITLRSTLLTVVGRAETARERKRREVTDGVVRGLMVTIDGMRMLEQGAFESPLAPQVYASAPRDFVLYGVWERGVVLVKDFRRIYVTQGIDRCIIGDERRFRSIAVAATTAAAVYEGKSIVYIIDLATGERRRAKLESAVDLLVFFGDVLYAATADGVFKLTPPYDVPVRFSERRVNYMQVVGAQMYMVVENNTIYLVNADESVAEVFPLKISEGKVTKIIPGGGHRLLVYMVSPRRVVQYLPVDAPSIDNDSPIVDISTDGRYLVRVIEHANTIERDGKLVRYVTGGKGYFFSDYYYYQVAKEVRRVQIE